MRVTPSRIYSIVFLEGFASIAIEMLIIRQLIPFVGNSVIMTSLVIGIFLLFLSLGYYRGGLYQHDLQRRLKGNLTYASLFLGMGGSIAYVSVYFNFFQKHLIVSLVIYLLSILAPLIYFVGQTLPITMRLMTSEDDPVRGSARVLALSTLGSFLGAVVTTTLLMAYWGVAWTLTLVVGIMLIIALLVSSSSQYRMQVFLTVTIVIMTLWLNVWPEKQLFVKTSSYANYQIMSLSDSQLLRVNNSYSAYMKEKGRGFEYIEYIKKVLFKELALRDKQILVIGAGGFSLTAQGLYDNHITYVDIDDMPKILKKAWPKPNFSTFIKQDARSWLRSHHHLFDVIISDAYSSKNSIPSHLITRESFQLISKHLTAQGLAVFNMIIDPQLQDPFSKRVDNTLSSVFSSCMKVPLSFAFKDNRVNVVYVCFNNGQSHDRTVYRDDKHTVTQDHFR